MNTTLLSMVKITVLRTLYDDILLVFRELVSGDWVSCNVTMMDNGFIRTPDDTYLYHFIFKKDIDALVLRSLLIDMEIPYV